MPTAHNPGNPLRSRLAALPKHPGLVIAGGKANLDTLVREGNTAVRPGIALWLDGGTGLVRGSTLYSPTETTDDGISQALEALVAAMAAPLALAAGMVTPEAGLPGLVIVNDDALAAAARELLGDFGVPVEVHDQLEVFDEAYAALSESLRDNLGQTGAFTWDVDLSLLPALFAAADRYQGQAAWKTVPDYPPVSIMLGEASPLADTTQLFGAILGHGGQLDGLALYLSLDDYELSLDLGSQSALGDIDVDQALDFLRDIGAPLDKVPGLDVREFVADALQEQMPASLDPADAGNSFGCFFDPIEEVDPTYLTWLREHNLVPANPKTVPTFMRVVSGEGLRMPDSAEVVALTLALDAVTQFSQQVGSRLDPDAPTSERLTHTARVERPSGTVNLDVTYPAADFIWVDEPEDLSW